MACGGSLLRCLWIAVAAFSLVSCNKSPATAVVVHIVGSDEVRALVAGARATGLRVRARLQVRSGSASGENLTMWRENEVDVVSANPILLDATLTPTNNDASRLYEVIGSVLVGDTVRGQVRAKSGYARGRVLYLRLEVVRDCSLTETRPTCSENETCDAAGGCVNASRPASSLPDYVPSMGAGLDSGIEAGRDVAVDTSMDSIVADVVEENSCASGHHLCGATCVLDTSPNSCGSRCAPCPTPPGGSASCSAGTCMSVCDPPTIPCGSACVVTSSDPLNCGGCGLPCGSNQICNSGVCVDPPMCPPDTNCPMNTYCAAGFCVTGCDDVHDCVGVNGRCDRQTHLCGPGCDNDGGDCPGRTCDTNSGQCVCPTPQVWCGVGNQGQCQTESATACGPECSVCPVPAGGTATCLSNHRCGILCTPPAVVSGDVCVLPPPWSNPPAFLDVMDSVDLGRALAFGVEGATVELFVGDPGTVVHGSVHRWRRTNGSWSRVVGFNRPTPAGAFVNFGAVLDANSQYVLVGDSGDPNENSGGLYLYNIAGGNWGNPAQYTGSVTRVSLHTSNQLVVAAPPTTLTKMLLTGTWSTYAVQPCQRAVMSDSTHFLATCNNQLFVFLATNLSSVSLTSPDNISPGFGDTLAANDRYLFVGDSGRVHLYSASDPSYPRQATTLQRSACASFGSAIVARNNRIAIACGDGTGVQILNAALQEEVFLARPSGASDAFGEAIAIAPSGNLVAIGDPEANAGLGRVYVYSR